MEKASVRAGSIQKLLKLGILWKKLGYMLDSMQLVCTTLHFELH